MFLKKKHGIPIMIQQNYVFLTKNHMGSKTFGLPFLQGEDGAIAQLIFGPAAAKSVKLAVEAIVSHVDGLDFPAPAVARMAFVESGTVGFFGAKRCVTLDQCLCYN